MEKVSSPNLTMVVSLLLRGAKVGPCPVGVLQTPVRSVKPEPKPENPIGQTVVPPVVPPTPAQPVQPATPAQPVAAEPAAKAINDQLATQGKEEAEGGTDIPEEPEKKGIFERIKVGLRTSIEGLFRPDDKFNDDDDDY